MVSSQIVVLALATSALGATLGKRDFSKVYSDTQTLNTDAVNLKNAVNSYDGSFGTALKLNSVGQQFQTDLKNAGSDCSASAAYTAAQCTQENNYLLNTFEPNLKAALTAIKNKKATFTANGFKQQISDNLNGFKSATDSFIACNKGKCPTASQSTMQTTLNKIDVDFNDAINYYKS